jgi:BirA family biotin operon repressor/biotin-[acetyl-CoA-carboxylase] ligase
LFVSSIVWRLEHFAEIDSTNTWTVARALEGANEGVVAFADFQSSGRGRLDRTWESPPGASLLCSILLRPIIGPDQLQLVVASVALAARAALVRLCGVRPSLKWPNDLIVGDSKIAGLLAELVSNERGPAVVVGIGVNLTYAGPVGAAGTSVLAESGVTIAPEALLDILLDELEPRRWLLDTHEGRSQLRDEYLGALSTIGQMIRVERIGDSLAGVATSIDASGHLIVQVDGSDHVIVVGDVVHVRPHDGPSQ